LKLAIQGGLDYEVEAFDGRRSAARSANLHLLDDLGTLISFCC